MAKPVQFSSVYKEVSTASVVDHSLWCHFVDPRYKSLVTIGGTLIRVWGLLQGRVRAEPPREPSNVRESVLDEDMADLSAPQCPGETEESRDLKTDLVLSLDLASEVVDAVSVRFYGDTCDSIMLSFEEARVAAIRFDPMSYDVKTIILNNFQWEPLKQYRSQFSKPPMLRIDPEQRCAIVLVYDKFLGIIPFRRSPDIIATSLTTNENRNKRSVITPLNIPCESITQHELFSGIGLVGINRPPPALPSYVTDLNLLQGVKINYILDMKFLHGYFEPTLMILYDPIGTFVGQALTRKDTCCMITLSLNLQKRSNPVIWHIENLPYDCFKIVPVPRPIGGVVILSTNILIYLNQSQPSCGIGLNGYSKIITNFPLRQTSVLHPISLDSCECRFINSEQMLLVSKSGDIFIVTLLLETAMRTVIGAHIEKNFKTVIPKTISILSPNHIFIGSQITDSVILYYEAKEDIREVFVTSDIPVYLMDSNCSSSVGIIDNKKSNIKCYTFRENDIIKNIGPIGTISVSENFGFSSNDITDPHQIRLSNEMSYVELLTTTSYGEFGTVSLLNLTVKPRLQSIFELSKDILEMWWVSGSEYKIQEKMEMNVDETIDDECYEDEVNGVNEFKKSYIILSKQKQTMVLEIGKEIVELEKSGFKTDEATLCSGNIGSVYFEEKKTSYSLIFQILSNSVRLLNGSQLLENLRLDTDWPIIEVTTCDKYILLRTEFDIFLIQLTSAQLFAHDLQVFCDESTEVNKYLSISKREPRDGGQVCCFTMFYDTTGFIHKAVNYEDDVEDILDEDNNENKKPDLPDTMDEIDIAIYGLSKVTNNKNDKPAEAMIIDSQNIPEDSEDIEHYLYGDNSFNENREKMETCIKEEQSDFYEESFIQIPTTDDKLAQCWTFILYTDGVLEIYTVPDFVCVFKTHNFFDACNLMINDLKLNHFGHIQASYNDYYFKYDTKQKFEIVVCGIGRNKDRPVLFMRDQNEIIMYEILPPVPRRARYIPDLGDFMRLKKIPLPCLIRPVKKVKDDKELNEIHRSLTDRSRMLKPFEDIGGFRGLFVSGSYPMWLFFSKDGHIRTFPMYVEGAVTCFAVNPYKQSAVAQCAYFNYLGEMKLINLPINYDYEYAVAVKSIKINHTVHFVQYHIESRTYALITSEDKEVTSIFKLNAENSKEEEVIERDKDIIRAPLSDYTLQFYANDSTGLWEMVPNARNVFEEWDKVTCMATVQLSSQMTYSGTKDFIAIGSNMTYGEEIPVRGKIMIIDIIDVVPEPGKMLTRHKIKTIYDVEQKGPVTALTSCKGYLVSAIGQKVYIWELRDNDLVGVAFVDSEIYVHQLHCVRNLIIAGDFLKSIQLLRFQSDLRVLSLVSKDHKARGVMCCNFFVDNENLGFLMTDIESNVIIYSYNPLDEDSRNGKQLIRNSDMRLPITVTCSLRINDRIRDPIFYSTPSVTLTQELLRQSLYFGCPTGAIYRISPISNRQLVQMKLIEKNLGQCLHPYAGLQTKDARAYKFTEPELINSCGNIAEGNLLIQYVTLPHSQRIEIAKKAGVEIDRILDDLTDIFSGTLHF